MRSRMVQAYKEALKENRGKILKNYVKRYRNRGPGWASTLAKRNTPLTNLIDEYFPEDNIQARQELYEFYQASLKYAPIPGDPSKAHIRALQVELERNHTRIVKLMYDIHRGYYPKLSSTQATLELLLRGFVHYDQTEDFERDKYIIGFINGPLVWPEQFEQHQDGLIKMKEVGLPSHTQCLPLELNKKYYSKIK